MVVSNKNQSIVGVENSEKIAQLKGLPAEQVERQTWENGVRFFGIPQE